MILAGIELWSPAILSDLLSIRQFIIDYIANSMMSTNFGNRDFTENFTTQFSFCH
jgi:hypothetical protein